MKKLTILFFALILNLTYSQNNGFIIKNNDTINVEFSDNSLHIRSFGKIEKLQSKVKYKLNGETITAKPSDLDGFCIKTDERNYCFDSFTDDKSGKGSFAFRVFGNKVDKLTVYQYYGSGFIGINYSVSLGYLVKKNDIQDLSFPVTFPKKWKEALSYIVRDCPDYQKYVDENVKKITFENEFYDYLTEYYNKCKK
ncbi:hypothetical protein LUD75_01520 [Epilithonimonas sp. JDS]|uniref:hypothetical protein n=1 Tax=Epilithonimonas sp. JDS TaxID=2902797 RepID=UPI001E466548|nr:hypothetical protein [Epilithonimonas sp. JDS]MCD9853367.1 hypothetical protein [Epilithonimonas sp. JDS]